MKHLVIALAPLLLFAGCGDPAPASFDATVRFTVGEADGDTQSLIETVVTTVLAVAKPGRTTIVDAWGDDAPEGTRYGRHKFPPNTGAPAIAAYYGGVLANAGWTDADFRIESDTATVRLFGVTRIESRADGDQVQVKVERKATR